MEKRFYQLVYFNPRSLTGATLPEKDNKKMISNFNPRSLTGATAVGIDLSTCDDISIHAPLRERHTSKSTKSAMHDFNPRSLTGATTISKQYINNTYYFNPRSLTGAIACTESGELVKGISIHAPLRERRSIYVYVLVASSISIHAPLRERLLAVPTCFRFYQISIHAPLRERLRLFSD